MEFLFHLDSSHPGNVFTILSLHSCLACRRASPAQIASALLASLQVWSTTSPILQPSFLRLYLNRAAALAPILPGMVIHVLPETDEHTGGNDGGQTSISNGDNSSSSLPRPSNGSIGSTNVYLDNTHSIDSHTMSQMLWALVVDDPRTLNAASSPALKEGGVPPPMSRTDERSPSTSIASRTVPASVGSAVRDGSSNSVGSGGSAIPAEPPATVGAEVVWVWGGGKGQAVSLPRSRVVVRGFEEEAMDVLQDVHGMWLRVKSVRVCISGVPAPTVLL